MTKQKIFVVMLFSMFSIFNFIGYAQVNTLIVEDIVGNRTSFSLSDFPIVSCDGGQLSVETSAEKLNLDIEEVHSYYFESCASVESVQDTDASVKIASGNIYLTGLVHGCPISIYRLDGKLLRSMRADDEGNAVIEGLQGMGVAIVRAGSLSFKIVIR